MDTDFECQCGRYRKCFFLKILFSGMYLKGKMSSEMSPEKYILILIFDF